MSDSAGAKLRRAAKLVEQACATLDASKAESCGSCGLQKANNWDEAQIWKQLSGVPDKLRSNASRLEKAQERRVFWEKEQAEA